MILKIRKNYFIFGLVFLVAFFIFLGQVGLVRAQTGGRNINTFEKPFEGTLFATEWNDLLGYNGFEVFANGLPLGSFVPTFLPAMMLGPLGIGMEPVVGGARLNVKADGTNNILSLQNNVGTEIMTVLNSGNVGIGTTAPNYPLEVLKTTANTDVTQLTLKNSDNGVGAGTSIGFSPITTNILTGKISNIRDAGGEYSLRFYNYGAGGNAERMRINYLGNVGIGTTVPGHKLSVTGSATSYSIDAGNQRIGNVADPTATKDVVNLGYLNSSLSAFAPGGASSTWALNGNNIYNTNSGNVGIGTTNPSQQLEITKNFRLPATTYNSGNPYGIIYKDGLPFIHNFSYGLNSNGVTPGGRNVFIGENAGNLTMGSTATGSYQSSNNTALGTLALRNNTTGYYNFALGTWALTANTTGVGNIAVGIQSLYSNVSGGNNISFGSFSLYSNTSSNNIAIGDSSLFSKTSGASNIAIGTNSARYLANGTTGAQVFYNSTYIGGSTKVSAEGVTNENVFGHNAIGTGSNSVTLGNDSIVKTVLKGNVGIGTTEPTQALEVYGANNGLAFTRSASTGSARLYYKTAETYLWSQGLRSNRDDYTIFDEGTALERLTILKSNGNVGIGTTNPGGALHVVGGANKILFSSTSNSYGQMQLGNPSGKETSMAYIGNLTAFGNPPTSSSGNTFIWNQGVGLYSSLGSQYSIANANYGGPSFLADSNGGISVGAYAKAVNTPPAGGLIVSGNVGIGTTAPTQKLSIGGSATSYSIDAGNQRIGNVADPDTVKDVVTLGFLNSSLSAFAPGGASSTWALNGNNIYNTNSGNVGIGTSTPGLDKLRVVGGPVGIFGSLNLNNNNITGINKLTVNTIDPLYNIGGTNYSTFAAAIVGGVKEEYVGRLEVKTKRAFGDYEAVIDFNKQKEGTDLWVWHKTVDFSKENVEVFLSPYGDFARTYFLIEGEKLIVRADRPVTVSYRLVGRRLDWREWPTKALDQEEKAGFVIN